MKQLLEPECFHCSTVTYFFTFAFGAKVLLDKCMLLITVAIQGPEH